MLLSRQQSKLIELLSDRKWHDNAELNAVCFRYGGRIMELRGRGYVIAGERIDNHGLWRYRLTETPNDRMLKPHLERSEADLAERIAALAGSCGAASGHEKAGGAGLTGQTVLHAKGVEPAVRKTGAGPSPFGPQPKLEPVQRKLI